MGAFDMLADVVEREAVCGLHGTYTSRRYLGAIWTKCPACTAAADKAEEDAAAATDRDRERRLWEAKVGRAQIPERFRDRSLQSYVATTDGQKGALAFATSYADSFADVLKTGRSAVFLGKPGTGKTHLAVGIALRVMHRDGRTVLFTTVMRAIRRIKDTWSRRSSESETEAIKAFVFPDLLILDEVGVQFGTDAERLILFDILNERYERRRPTILLSNLTVDEVKAFLGDRVFDRLREDGGQVIVFDWESHRGR